MYRLDFGVVVIALCVCNNQASNLNIMCVYIVYVRIDWKCLFGRMKVAIPTRVVISRLFLNDDVWMLECVYVCVCACVCLFAVCVFGRTCVCIYVSLILRSFYDRFE